MSIHSRIKQLREANGLSMEALAKRVGVSAWQTVQQWEREEKGTAPKRARLQAVADALGTTPEYLLVGDAGAERADDDAEFVGVHVLNVKASAGAGRLVFEESAVGLMAFRTDFLRSMSIARQDAVMMTVQGMSMEPTLPDGSVVLVDTSQTNPRARGVFVVLVDDELMIKRVRVEKNGDLVLTSDNPDKTTFPDRKFAAAGKKLVQIKGRARWFSACL
ncbi:XRE family transcriptional regulator [Chitinasiproducens palmae]|uniref:Phage repressor protein C, contains Cro/C1-type HTH and peptisase s24 domains n=1 Tax=Chitinasiproducens palmae TaxID=1770053 RepID=A0A1H2PS65_9BURK|nr:LexA family transcriptional regulator [Chitinasiproducens palmae]SDV49790.1 Phage repressor protein C, contains Cro/C1-type HTH and peptisase s24 domains [Chitinasiproducens palmae]